MAEKNVLMKILLLLIPICLLSTLPVRSDLGAADAGTSRMLSGRKHEAWCGTKSNQDCIITFKEGRMKVDGGAGITPSQIKTIYASKKMFLPSSDVNGMECEWLSLGPKHCHAWIEINYVNSSGESRWATIRYANRNAYLVFKSDMEAWTGEPLRAVGPELKVTQ